MLICLNGNSNDDVWLGPQVEELKIMAKDREELCKRHQHEVLSFVSMRCD